MPRRKPAVAARPPLPDRVWEITKKRGREVVRSISKCTSDVTLNDIAMAGYLQGLEDMATALRMYPQYAICSQDEHWSLP